MVLEHPCSSPATLPFQCSRRSIIFGRFCSWPSPILGHNSTIAQHFYAFNKCYPQSLIRPRLTHNDQNSFPGRLFVLSHISLSSPFHTIKIINIKHYLLESAFPQAIQLDHNAALCLLGLLNSAGIYSIQKLGGVVKGR